MSQTGSERVTHYKSDVALCARFCEVEVIESRFGGAISVHLEVSESLFKLVSQTGSERVTHL